MKKKILLYSSIALILGSGIGGFAYNQKVEAEEAKQEQIRVENKEVAVKAIAALYSKDKAALTDEDFESKLQKAKTAIEKVTDSKGKKQLLDALNQADELNKLDSEVASLIKNGVVDKKATLEQVQDLTKRIAEVKEWNESIFNTLSKQLEEADKQLAAINKATKKVKEAEKTLKDKDYDAASDLVAKVQNEEKKKELTKQLKKINEKVIAKVKAAEEEAKRKEKEQAIVEVAEQAQTNSQVNQNVTSNNVNSKTASQSKSNSYSTGSSSNSSSVNNSATSKSSGTSYSSNKSTSSTTSKSTKSSNNSNSSKQSNSSSKSSGSSSNNSSSSSNSGNSTSTKQPGKVDGVTVDGGGNLESNYGGSGGTWETGTFEWGN